MSGDKLSNNKKRKKSASIKGSKSIMILVIAILAAAAVLFMIIRHAGTTAGKSRAGRDGMTASALTLEEEKKELNTEITVSLTGDFILGTDEFFNWDTGFNAYYDNFGGAYFLENVRDVFEKDDLTIINFECTLTEETARENKQFAFKGEPKFVDVLTTSSVEGANTANNHSHDYGEKSYTDTLDVLEKNGIQTVGYDKVAIYEVKGLKIGAFGIYELDDHLARIPQMEENIIKLKDMGADIIIGIFHWSNELETSPDLNARTLAHLAIDEGVDLVVGHHPHILQGVETYKGKHIAYSLGNFCFGGNSHPREFDTVIYQETFKIKDGEVVGRDMNLIPTCISSNWDYNDYKPTVMTGTEAERILQKIKDRSDEIIHDFDEPDTASTDNSNTDGAMTSADDAVTDTYTDNTYTDNNYTDNTYTDNNYTDYNYTDYTYTDDSYTQW